ncbi:HNH endonuclease [Clostridium gasigenes]|uniref:HNH endonuclease n=1 Tax=Clostridium gasigenes TaxID=94869 RepID=A0A7X0SJ04_9CLOT|nr:HNH endonuclease [Clostridium gasigenes]MBB6716351.1 HNH endonuclease [Clostridium gasigenes]
MPKIKLSCENCNVEVYRYPSGVLNHIFCSRECSKTYLSNKMSDMNKELNPNRMTEKVKENIRWSHLLKGEGKAYPKIHGRHAHRVIAEKKIGRKLKKGEVVHHIDGNKLNYNENNLEVISSQKEHAKIHNTQGRFSGLLKGVTL